MKKSLTTHTSLSFNASANDEPYELMRGLTAAECTDSGLGATILILQIYSVTGNKDVSPTRWTFRLRANCMYFIYLHVRLSHIINITVSPLDVNFAPKTFRSLDVSHPGCFAPKTFRPLDVSPTHWTFRPRDVSHPGRFAHAPVSFTDAIYVSSLFYKF